MLLSTWILTMQCNVCRWGCLYN